MNKTEKLIDDLNRIKIGLLHANIDGKPVRPILEKTINMIEQQSDNSWVPLSERKPDSNWIKGIWVTAVKPEYNHRIVLKLNLEYGRFVHPNGREISPSWKLLAWKMPEYPEPWEG